MTDDLRQLKDVEAALLEVERRKAENSLSFYHPYARQQEFHDLSLTLRERLLMAGNQNGKTYCGGAEVAFHLTGRYPDWWLGRRWSRPVRGWVAGVTGESTRDNPQRILLGAVVDIKTHGVGRGLIPQDCLDRSKMTTARGVGDLFDTVLVKHFTEGVFDGWSEMKFKSYERGREKWQGESLDFIWYDEEPDEEIYSEGLARIIATNGMVFVTFTPLQGKSKVVSRYMDEPSPDRGIVSMTIDDAEHIPVSERKKIIDGFLPHEREARSKGIPMLGSGKIFMTLEENILVPPFPLPRHWRYIWGTDFGIEHPFAAVLLGMDMDTDVIYVMQTVRMKDATPLLHTQAMKPCCGGKGDTVPMAWPQDGWQRKEFEGALKPTALIYKKHKQNVLDKHATFLDGTNSTWAGIMEMRERFASKRLLVFSHCTDWIQEYRDYHMKDGQIVKFKDDLLSATRVGIMAKRFAKSVLWAPHTQDGRGPNETGLAKDVDCDPWG